MPQTELFKYAKKMKRANPAFVPIPASTVTKRPLGKWSLNNYLFERDFPKREGWESNCNIGLLVSDEYIVVDVDAKPPAVNGKKNVYSNNHGTVDFQTLIEQNEPLPVTLTVTTPSGGKHYYFSLTGKEGEERLKNWTSCMNVNNRLIAVDIRKKGGYVMCPPSLKGTKRYRWDTNDEFNVPMAPFPNWILKNITTTMTKHQKHFEMQIYTSNPVENTELNDDDVETLMSSKYWQKCFKIASSSTVNNLYIITATAPYDCDICERQHITNSNHPFLVRNNGILKFVCRPGKGFNRILDIDYLKLWEDFHPPTKTLIENMDVSNRAVSELLFQHLNNTVLPTANMNKWLVFDEKTGVWREEFRNVILRPVTDYFVKLVKELSQICSKLRVVDSSQSHTWDTRMTAANDLDHSLSMTSKKNDHLAALFELIRDSRKDALFNTKRGLLHCANGVYDLEKEEFREARPDDYSTMSTNIKYLNYDEHPKEKRDIIEKFLDDVMLGRTELIEFLLKIMSSTLDGYVRDQFFFFFHGVGANAKSLLIKLLKICLGDYGATIPSALVTKANVNAQAASPALVALTHKRGSFLTELEDKVLFTEFLKMVAGGDQTSGRALYKEQVVVDLMTKVFIAVNDLPNIEDKTRGFWRKVVIIPFDCSFTDDPKLPHEKKIIERYEETLLQCADTFLALLIKTYITSYKKDGIRRVDHPKIVTDLVSKYEESQNIPLQFVNGSISKTNDKNMIISTASIDEAFSNFCRAKGITKNSQIVKHLYEMLDKLFPPKNERRQVWSDGKNVRAWVGGRLLNDWELAGDENEVYENVDKKDLREKWAASKSAMVRGRSTRS
ncbi:bifunctional DNA primase/polymerase [Phlyctochytrium arcticum]|nr:bifunctional DNA primase/polymerase [Phlyctochytrium arcticum]